MEEERQYLLARGQTGAEHIIVHHCLPIIDNAPTVAERLIRCKDCKHTVLSEDGKKLICCLTMRVGTVRPTFYCGNGEMKGGAE
jgi:hypothetical protein